MKAARILHDLGQSIWLDNITRDLLKTGWLLREGRVPAAGERRVAVLGDTAAASLGKKLDDDLELIGQTFRVVGIAAYTTTVNRGLVLVPLIDLQEASYRPRQVTIVHVNVEHASGRAELGSVRVAIEALGKVTASTANEVLP